MNKKNIEDYSKEDLIEMLAEAFVWLQSFQSFCKILAIKNRVGAIDGDSVMDIVNNCKEYENTSYADMNEFMQVVYNSHSAGE